MASRSASRMNRGGDLARVAHAEVDQLAARGSRLSRAPVEFLERIRLDLPDARRQVRHVCGAPSCVPRRADPDPRNARRIS